MSGDEAGRRDGRHVIGSRLAAAESQLRAMQAQVHADLELTRFDEPVPELDELVDGLVALLRGAARRLGVPPDQRSARRSAGAILSLMWADLVEIEPERLVRAWGAHDLPDEWQKLHARLLGAVRSAQTAVDRRAVRGSR
jgi:hypothetical protein